MATDKVLDEIKACELAPIRYRNKGQYGLVYEVGDSKGDIYAFKYSEPTDFTRVYGVENLIEIDILSRVNHPNIIHKVSVITSHNYEIENIAVVLPLAERTLLDLIRDPYLTSRQKLPILYRIIEAIDFLHESHILHLDIKSENIVVQGLTSWHPYIIDFSLSMKVDDIITGKYYNGEKVTINYRAPEILAGSRQYNAAVDIWAYGIIMLYLLSGSNYTDIDFITTSSEAVHNIILSTFSDDKRINEMTKGIDPKYRDLCRNLLISILQIDPKLRPTARQICDHPLFDEFRSPICGFLVNSLINYQYAPDHRDILKLLINWLNAAYPAARCELLFLAVELYYRVSSFYSSKSPLDRMIMAATCIWMACKLTDDYSITLTDFLGHVNKLAPNVTNESVLSEEMAIISYLDGIVYSSRFYDVMSNAEELRLTFNHIIMDKDSTLYARTDIPAWLAVMPGYITATPASKNVTVANIINGTD